MNEERYASRVRQVLNHGLKEIPAASSRRLEAARHLALSHQKQEAPQLAPAGDHRHGRFHFMSESRRLRQILAVLALLFGMWISFYLEGIHGHKFEGSHFRWPTWPLPASPAGIEGGDC